MKYKLKTIIFETNVEPKCNLCGSDLLTNIIRIKSDPHKNINKCLNVSCDTNLKKFKRKEIWKAFLPEKEYKNISDKMYNVMISNNRLKIDFWIKKGLTREEASEKISEIQSKNSKLVKDRFIVSKENLKVRGYSDEEIGNICQTPSMMSFWLKKGFSEKESRIKLYEMQSNAAKQVDFEKRILPSNIEYWMNIGFCEESAKLKVSEHQRTFSLEKCIKKYGEVDGVKVWNERQEKWQKSLYKNGNIKGGYSKVSQELFDIISKFYKNLKYATNNSELVIRVDKKNYYYDFTDTDRKKIIEYNGDQYHANPSKYESNSYPHPYRKGKGDMAKDIWKYDSLKREVAVQNGYDYLIIWDSEYKQNKEIIIQKCIDFLNK